MPGKSAAQRTMQRAMKRKRTVTRAARESGVLPRGPRNHGGVGRPRTTLERVAQFIFRD